MSKRSGPARGRSCQRGKKVAVEWRSFTVGLGLSLKPCSFQGRSSFDAAQRKQLQLWAFFVSSLEAGQLGVKTREGSPDASFFQSLLDLYQVGRLLLT